MLHLFLAFNELSMPPQCRLWTLRVIAFVDSCSLRRAHGSLRYIIYRCTT